MKTLFALHQFFPEHYAGTEVLTLGLVKELKARGHEPYVFAAKRSFPIHELRPGEIEDYEFEGIPVRRVGRPEEGPFMSYELDYHNEMMAERAREYAREVAPDAVHVMHLQGLSASVIAVFKEFGAPLVYTATDFWAVCPVVDLRRHDGAVCRGPEIAHCPRCVLSRPPHMRHPGSQRIRRVMDLAPDGALRAVGRLSRTRLSDHSYPLRLMRALGERPGAIRELLEPVDRVIAPTRVVRDLLVANGVVGESKVEVSHYGIDVSGIQSVSKKRNVPPLRIGFNGSLAPHKGCDVLVRAFKALPPNLDVTLTINGGLDKPKPFIKKLRWLAGDDRRINFVGPFAREELGHILSEMDVLVVPSRWYENAPVVIYEAFAAKTPVVATDLGGMSEVVEHEKNGLLFELENVKDLARQLLRLYEEPGLLERLRAGIGHVKTVEEKVDELEELYASLTKERPRT